MTEAPLYAVLAALMWIQAQAPSQPPCAACVSVSIAAGQALLLPDELHGVTVVLRTEGSQPGDLARLAGQVRGRGGRAAVLVTETGSPSADAGEQAYLLKLRLTELRGALGPDTLLALAWPADPGLQPYVDVLVARDGVPVPPDARVWRFLDGTTLAAALAATTRSGVEQWVVAIPGDVIEARAFLQALAAAAAPPPDLFTEDVEVRGSRQLTAGEIIARHQAFARRQASLVTRTRSTGVLTLTFEAPGFAAPVTITAETVIHAGQTRTELEQRAIRVNGIEFTGRGVPRLPILEPERAAAPPLVITLSNLYRYRLSGEASVNGVRCHVVAFQPVDRGAALFHGRAWIAMDTYAMVRVAAAQTGLRGAIVSSEQDDEFRESRAGIWLLARSNVRQIYEGAAYRTPIHRLLVISAHEIDPPDFDARLQAAYASPAIMLRDTPEGYRYLTRERGRPAAGASDPPEIVPVVAPRSDRMRTLTAGVIIDPNISVPLPFAGFSYVDFNLFGTGAQLNVFFGGSYAQLAFSAPSLAGTRWQLAGRAFGIASSYNDRSFRAGREVYAENLRQRPAHASMWLLRPVSPRVTIRAGYEFDYTRLQASDGTDAAFVVPPDQVVHAARVAIEGQRGGWAGSVWWNPARRAGWRAWGRTVDDYRPSHAGFQRYGATVSRSASLAPGLTTRVEGAVMAGQDLDRFSRYSFGAFDNRLRGYPSALVRYDRGGVIRGVLAWSAARVVRLDAFVDSALVSDRGFGRGYRRYTGIGGAVEAPAPFGLLTAVEWGYGFRGVNADGTSGTHVIRVSAFKVF